MNKTYEDEIEAHLRFSSGQICSFQKYCINILFRYKYNINRNLSLDMFYCSNFLYYSNFLNPNVAEGNTQHLKSIWHPFSFSKWSITYFLLCSSSRLITPYIFWPTFLFLWNNIFNQRTHDGVVFFINYIMLCLLINLVIFMSGETTSLKYEQSCLMERCWFRRD